MFLTRLFRYVMEHYPHLENGIYNVVDRVMCPLALKQTQKPRSDRGKARHSVSSTSAHHNYGSSSHQGDDDEDDVRVQSLHFCDEVFQEPMVNTATTTSLIPVSAADPITTAGEVVTTANVEIPEELNLAQTLIEIKSAKPKVVTTVATTVTPASSRPKAKGIVFHDQEEQAPASTPIVSPLQPSQAKDKGKAKMVESEKPLKKKDQIAFDE
ncbi:hypothetical protein Tco_0004390 [Tanacetum coccineum]